MMHAHQDDTEATDKQKTWACEWCDTIWDNRLWRWVWRREALQAQITGQEGRERKEDGGEAGYFHHGGNLAECAAGPFPLSANESNKMWVQTHSFLLFLEYIGATLMRYVS